MASAEMEMRDVRTAALNFMMLLVVVTVIDTFEFENKIDRETRATRAIQMRLKMKLEGQS